MHDTQAHLLPSVLKTQVENNSFGCASSSLLRLPAGNTTGESVTSQAGGEITQGQLLWDEACIAKETIC